MELKFRQQLLRADNVLPDDQDNAHQPLIMPQDRQAYNQDQQLNDDLDQLRMILRNPQDNRQPADDQVLLQRLLDLIFVERDAENENEQSYVLQVVSYQDVMDNLDYNECSICLDSFDQDPNGQLIHLPCSQKHIFHAQCIRAWLANKNE